MSKFTDTSDSVYSDYNTSGDPSSGVLEPVKSRIRGLFKGASVADTPELYGAVGDTQLLDDGHVDASFPTAFSSASGKFKSTDVGKPIIIMGAGSAGASHITTISAYGSPTAVTLAASALNTVSGARFAWGTDDTEALAEFFADNPSSVGAFMPGHAYISTAAITSQKKALYANFSPIVFAIPNHTDNCFIIKPPTKLISTQVESHYNYSGLWLEGMATGLDLMYIDDGSPCLRDIIWNNSYRDALQLNPHYSPNTAIENLIGNNWYMGQCGRHGAHLNLVGGNSTTIQVYINETVIHGWEIRGIGVRFGSTATMSNRANAIRLTYDGIDVAMVSANKVSCFRVFGANWDCASQFSLGGNAPGDVIYQNCINGTTGRQVEVFRIMAGGIENTAGIVPPNTPLLINGSALAAGDWIESYIEAIYYQWAFKPSDTLMATPADQNTFWNTTGTFGTGGHGVQALPFQKRPTDGRSLISADAYPNGGIIDQNFKNSLTPYMQAINLVVSSTINFDIPIRSLTAAAAQYQQHPMVVQVLHNPFRDSQTYLCFGRYLVFANYEPSGTITSVTAFADKTIVGSDLSYSFNPAVGSGIAFTIQSSSGSLKDILRITITGGANVGSGGSKKIVDLCASRWGVGWSENNRQHIDTTPYTELSFTQ